MNDHYIDKNCPFCKSTFGQTDTIVVCSQCDMPHHKECWIENQGCTTFGCLGTIQSPTAPSADAVGVAPASAEYPYRQEVAAVFCTQCGTRCSTGDSFCASCGNRLRLVGAPESLPTGQTTYPSPPPPLPSSVYPQSFGQGAYPPQNPYGYGGAYATGAPSISPEDGDRVLFIQTNEPYYLKHFSKLKASSSIAAWNWASFFLSVYWCFYRKMYKIGFLLLGVHVVGLFLPTEAQCVVALTYTVSMGVMGNYLYMQHVDKAVNLARLLPENQKSIYLKQHGGTSIGTAIGVCMSLSIFSFIVTSLRML